MGLATKICIEYYRDYGETLEATFCHDVIKNYEYEEVICNNTTLLESETVNQNSVRLQWSNSAVNSSIRGYHVYRNNTRITNQMLTEPAYLDENLPNGNYEYYVKTYYKEGCVSDMSNKIVEIINVGIDETDGIDKILIYPNPAFTTVTIEAINFSKVEIYNFVGQLMGVKSTKIIDVSSYNAGIYFF